MSGFFRNSPSKKPNVLTFPPPDLGMLRRSTCVLIFPKSRCIIYFALRAGFFRNSPSKTPNVLTFPPPYLGMLRRSRRVLILPKSRCIIYFDLRVPDYSNTKYGLREG